MAKIFTFVSFTIGKHDMSWDQYLIKQTTNGCQFTVKTMISEIPPFCTQFIVTEYTKERALNYYIKLEFKGAKII